MRLITWLLTSLVGISYAAIAVGPPAPPQSMTVLKNWGLTNSQFHSHIDAIGAWKIEEGSRKIIVAVVDTGIDATHPDLKANLWNSKGTYGWNFVTNKANPVDEHGHGTHIAGIIGAALDLKNGVSGVAHRVSIMATKYYSDTNPGSLNLKNTVKAINYAVEHGARIINYSGGGPEFSEDEYLALVRAQDRGILVVAAAGNEHADVDQQVNYYYPGAYRLPNILVVGASDIRNNPLATSNWGKTRVDVMAPGENIYSTLPGGRYGYMSGTSQATAFVSGLAALMLSRNPKLKPTEIIRLIKESVDTFPQLKDKCSSGGRINAVQALESTPGP